MKEKPEFLVKAWPAFQPAAPRVRREGGVDGNVAFRELLQERIRERALPAAPNWAIVDEINFQEVRE